MLCVISPNLPYNWKFAPFEHLHPFWPTPSTLIAGSHHSVFYICEFSFGLSFDSTCKWNHVYVCLWLISLNIIPLAFIHVITNDRIFFFFKGWIIFYCLCMCILHFLYPLVHWWTEITSMPWSLSIMLQWMWNFL